MFPNSTHQDTFVTRSPLPVIQSQSTQTKVSMQKHLAKILQFWYSVYTLIRPIYSTNHTHLWVYIPAETNGQQRMFVIIVGILNMDLWTAIIH